MQHGVVDAIVEDGDLLQRGEADSIGGRVGELDRVELDCGRLVGLELDGVVGIGDQRLDVEHFEDPLEADERGRHVESSVGQGGQRRVQPVEEERQRDDGAGVELALECQVAAEAVDDRLGEAGHQPEGAHEDFGRHRRADADVPDLAGSIGELVALDAGFTEQLHERCAGCGEPLGHL